MLIQFTHRTKKIINKEIKEAITRYGNAKTDFKKIREKTIEELLLNIVNLEPTIYCMAKDIIQEELENDNKAEN